MSGRTIFHSTCRFIYKTIFSIYIQYSSVIITDENNFQDSCDILLEYNPSFRRFIEVMTALTSI